MRQIFCVQNIAFLLRRKKVRLPKTCNLRHVANPPGFSLKKFTLCSKKRNPEPIFSLVGSKNDETFFRFKNRVSAPPFKQLLQAKRKGNMSEEQKGKLELRWLFSLAIVMYGMIFNGIVYGYTSPALPKLQHVNSTLVISDDEASWMSSLTSLGAPIGAILCGFLIEAIGKKWSAVFGQSLTFCVGHLLITFAQSVEYLYVGRFICGICQVSLYKIVPVSHSLKAEFQFSTLL